jgi:tyrosine-protein kinase Etk/Wzc
LLVDADVRRGSLHVAFGVRASPGLTDYLCEKTGLEEVLHGVAGGLTVMPSGTRSRRAPEMLASRRMADLLQELRQRYDAIVVDCAPLNAGVDAFVLGTLTSEVVLVLRQGVTDCRLAEAKLRILDRLPVRVVGAVLNAVRTTGDYRYYAYDYETVPTSVSSRKLAIPLVD